ncbi:MAG: MFS transporter [Acetobacterales bacterium]
MTPEATRRAILLGNIAHSYSHLFLPLFFVVALVLEEEFSAPFAEVAALAVPMTVLFGAGALPAGWLGDRWSPMGMMVVFYLGTGLSALFTGLAGSLLAVGVGLALIGLFTSIYHPVGIAWLVRVAAERRGRALGLNGVFGMFGPAVAVSLGALVTYGWGWRWAFILPGAAAVVLGLYFWWLMARRELVDIDGDAMPEPPMPHRGQQLRALGLLFVCVACNGVSFQALQAVLPKLFEQRLGVMLDANVMVIGALYTMVFVVAGCWQLFTGTLADRRAPQPIYVMAFALQIPLFLIAAAAAGWPLLLVGLMMLAANVGAQPAENSLIARLTPGHLRSRVFAVKFVTTLLVGSLGVALVPLVYGLTGDFFWLFIVLSISAGIALLTSLALPGEAALRRTAPADAPAE